MGTAIINRNPEANGEAGAGAKIGDVLHRITDDVKTIASNEVELAKLELTRTAKKSIQDVAVVLFGGSYEGVAVPVLPVTAVIAKLDDLRRSLDLEKMGIPTPLPTNPKVCSGCPLGFPRVVTAADRKDEALGRKLHVVTGPDGRAYHSECGDRFGWTPPHDDAVRKRFIPLA